MCNNMLEDIIIDCIWFYVNIGSVRLCYEKVKKIICVSGDELSFFGCFYFIS